MIKDRELSSTTAGGFAVKLSCANFNRKPRRSKMLPKMAQLFIIPLI